jgi:hypothetical protein
MFKKRFVLLVSFRSRPSMQQFSSMEPLAGMIPKFDELPSVILFLVFDFVRTEGLRRNIRLFLWLMSRRSLSHRLKLCGIYL